jgi:plastocyanin
MDQNQQNYQAPVSKKKRSTNTVLAVVIALLLLVGTGTVLWRSSLDNGDTGSQTEEVAENQPVEVLPDEQVQVNITEEGFSPSTVRVVRDSAITWLNESGEAIDLRSENAEFFDTDTSLENGDSYTFPFETEGEYTITTPQQADWEMVVIVE